MEEAFEEYLDLHLSEEEGTQIYPVARRLHERWIRAYSTSKRAKLHAQLRGELREYVETLKKKDERSAAGEK